MDYIAFTKTQIIRAEHKVQSENTKSFSNKRQQQLLLRAPELTADALQLSLDRTLGNSEKRHAQKYQHCIKK